MLSKKRIVKLKKVCIYCSSSSQIESVYFKDAVRLGHLLAKNKLEGICGGGVQGLMRAVSDAVIEKGGKMTGIIPRFMYEEGWGNATLSEVIITTSMHERKEKMAKVADAIIALPGGCGTLEELLEIITWKQLGIFSGPIVILNTNKYFDPLLEMLSRAIKENFMRENQAAIWSVAETPEIAIEKILYAENWLENPRQFALI